MRSHNRLIGILLGLGLLVTHPLRVKAQSIEELRLMAQSGQRTEAEALIQQLIAQSKHPQDLHEEYGTWLMEWGDYAQAIEHYKASITKKHTKSLPKLAQAYHANAQFDKVLEVISRMGSKSVTEDLNLLKEYALRAQIMLDRSEWVEVIDSIRIDIDALPVLPSRYFSQDWGKLHRASEKSDEIENLRTTGLIYETALGLEWFYERIGAMGDSDLFYALSLQGRLSDEQALNTLNTPENERYPILRQDGITLIFARESHDGIGGYDLYLSRRDPETNTYQTPTLLGMPFNSPADDLYLIYDDLRGVGLLASTRYCPKGKVNLYTFRINENHPAIPFNTLDEKRPIATLYPWRATQEK